MRGNNWLLIKHRDEFASTKDIEMQAPTSVLSGRLLREIAADEGGDVTKAATGDPAPVAAPDLPREARPESRRLFLGAARARRTPMGHGR
jgi:hypothetical protein